MKKPYIVTPAMMEAGKKVLIDSPRVSVRGSIAALAADVYRAMEDKRRTRNRTPLTEEQRANISAGMKKHYANKHKH